ncbi:ATP-grasp domain-containing protein [Virgibacillus natechei]|uniref:ATP-grasp domain-containing protein n=1 Tax=Virgibacillus sp. CBA3643 TaxID=2942278 RepID=UPI0035A264B0
MHGWLIYSRKDVNQNSAYIDWFIEEAKQQYVSLELVLREEITIGVQDHQRIMKRNGKTISKPVFAVVRTIDPLFNLHLEAYGIIIFNSAAVSRICNDKALTHHHMIDLEIPMVDTYFYKKDMIPNPPPIPYPFIVKETAGRGGNQVYYIENKQAWLDCASTIRGDYLIQTSHVQLGKDLRVFVVGKEIVGAVLRKNSQDFRANFKLGGSARLYELQRNELTIINKIINYFHFDMVGIDFLIGLHGELLFNEIEDVVGSRTLSAVSDVNILQKYVTHIKSELNERNFKA